MAAAEVALVRVSERPDLAEQSVFQQTGHTLDHAHFQHFRWIQRRQQARQALGQH